MAPVDPVVGASPNSQYAGSKDEGGLGHRLMRPFLEALLGKQLAKLFARPSSLWARVIKHKYKPSRDVWELQ